MDRRNFLKVSLGAVSSLALASCGHRREEKNENSSVVSETIEGEVRQEKFSPYTREEAENLAENVSPVSCVACQYCMPCRFGIDIPEIFLTFNEGIKSGYLPTSVNDSAFADKSRKFLMSYDRAIEKVRQADHCIACGKCSHHCPQKIDIPSELVRIDKIVEYLKRGQV